MHSYGVTVMRQPDEPTEVRFIATVKDFYGNVIGKLGENGEYAATIGAPIPGEPFGSGGRAADNLRQKQRHFRPRASDGGRVYHRRRY